MISLTLQYLGMNETIAMWDSRSISDFLLFLTSVISFPRLLYPTAQVITISVALTTKPKSHTRLYHKYRCHQMWSSRSIQKTFVQRLTRFRKQSTSCSLHPWFHSKGIAISTKSKPHIWWSMDQGGSTIDIKAGIRAPMTGEKWDKNLASNWDMALVFKR